MTNKNWTRTRTPAQIPSVAIGMMREVAVTKNAAAVVTEVTKFFERAGNRMESFASQLDAQHIPVP